MKKVIASITAVAGLAVAASAQSTLLQYEVSLDGLSWHSSVNANPGQTVEVRARAILSNAGSITGGLSTLIYQPVVNNWLGASFTGNGAAGDNVVVQTQGAVTNTIGPIGGSRTTPLGSNDGAPGQYGRTSPFASSATSTSTYYRGFVGTGSNAGLMRISSAHITNWIGAGPTSGSNTINNVSGRGGVSSGQIAGANRLPSDPAYVTSQDVVMFKFAITLASATDLRTLNVSTPLAAIGRVLTGGLPGIFDVAWYNDPSTTSTTRTSIEVAGGNINVVPTPATLALMGLGGLVISRRRR